MNTSLRPESVWKSDNISGGPPLVSLIVTSYSSGRLRDLTDLLMSVAIQEPIDLIDLIVVIERERSLFEKVVTVLTSLPKLNSSVLFYSNLNGMSGARNVGAAASSAKYVAFVDDDTILEKEWLRSFRETVNNNDVVAITGPSHSLWTGSRLGWFPRELSWLVGSTEWFDCESLTEVRNMWGHNMAVRRYEFLAVNGFSEGLGLHSVSRSRWFDPPSEDVDISLRLRKKFRIPILYVPGFGVRHKVPLRKISLAFVAQRSYSTGYQRRAIKDESSAMIHSRKNSLYIERDLIPRMILLLPKSFVAIPKSLTKSMNIITIIFVAMLFSLLGYCDRRSY